MLPETLFQSLVIIGAHGWSSFLVVSSTSFLSVPMLRTAQRHSAGVLSSISFLVRAGRPSHFLVVEHDRLCCNPPAVIARLPPQRLPPYGLLVVEDLVGSGFSTPCALRLWSLTASRTPQRTI
jgi:hypothetical protein